MLAPIDSGAEKVEVGRHSENKGGGYLPEQDRDQPDEEHGDNVLE
ncbi:hypothetical protein QW131_22215 [Roseibium salinum]|nr:hypothetical protein [Roseibium salinum]